MRFKLNGLRFDPFGLNEPNQNSIISLTAGDILEWDNGGKFLVVRTKHYYWHQLLDNKYEEQMGWNDHLSNREEWETTTISKLQKQLGRELTFDELLKVYDESEAKHPIAEY